jgi:large subunit ribosomal protein L15
MKLKKRKKSSRRRGLRLGGWAAKKHKGTGNVGGPGMSGSGKQKKTFVIKYMGDYFGKPKRLKKRYKLSEINVGDIEKQIKTLKKKGLTKDGIEINLSKYKVLGDGEIKMKVMITAGKFTNSAKDKIEKAGGKIILAEKKKAEKKEEKKVVKKTTEKKKVVKQVKKAPAKKTVRKKGK